MKSIIELEEIRQKTLDKISNQNNTGIIRILVGMATCGIAAGAKPVMASFLEEIEKRNLSNVEVIITGCIGVCKLEPMVEVMKDGMRVTYVKMTAEKAARIVTEHLVNGRVVNEYTIGMEEDR